MVKITQFCVAAFFAVCSHSLCAADLRFSAETDASLFIYGEKPRFTAQDRADVQSELAATLHLNGRASSQWDLDSTLFIRYNPDAQKTVWADIRELRFSSYADNSSIAFGVLNEFWGSLEAYNPVDIINARDFIQDYEGDVKLGQPGIAYSRFEGDHQVDAYVLPYARERALPEGRDRYRFNSFDYASAQFEKNRYLPSVALRYKYTHERGRIALSQYRGYTRAPELIPDFSADGQPLKLIPNYPIINQTGLELEWLKAGAIFKAEMIYQSGGADSFFGMGLGVEREFPNVLNTNSTFTPFLEVYYDNRSEQAPVTAFDNDIYMGARLLFNDLSDSQIQTNVLWDWESHAYFYELGASRRIGNDWLLSADVTVPINTDEDPALNGFSEDKRIMFQLRYHF